MWSSLGALTSTLSSMARSTKPGAAAVAWRSACAALATVVLRNNVAFACLAASLTVPLVKLRFKGAANHSLPASSSEHLAVDCRPLNACMVFAAQLRNIKLLGIMRHGARNGTLCQPAG